MEKKSLRDISLQYDREFKQNFKQIKLLVKYLKTSKEQELATKWISRVGKLKSSNIDVKKNRNAFLKYLLKVIKTEICTEYLESGIDIFETDFQNHKEQTESSEKKSENQCHAKWSEDYRTYVAVQPIPGEGALVYMAVSKIPGIENWDLPFSN